MSRNALPIRVLLFCFFLAAPGASTGAEDDGFAVRPWLEDRYSWSEDYDFSTKGLKAAEAGAYAIGNGRAFALVGLTVPLWTWTNLYGASYQEPSLGSLRMSVEKNGKILSLTRQSVAWVRRSGAVRVTASEGGIEVDTVDYAPAGSNKDSWDNPPALVRLVRIRNRGEKPLTDLALSFRFSDGWGVKGRSRREEGAFLFEQDRTRAKPSTWWKLGALLAPEKSSAEGTDKGLTLRFPGLLPGGETTAAIAFVSSGTEKGLAATWTLLEKKGPWIHLDRTRAFWSSWHSSGVRFSGNQRLTDLFEIQSQIYKVQQAATGPFSPLIGYSYAWIRDHNGPIRWFLKSGHAQEARSAIDFFEKLAATMGSLPNSVRVDYKMRRHYKDLSGIRVEHAETPNWIILQHWWQYLSDGDLEVIRSRWSYLKRCLTGQVMRDDKLFFHRDETYLWCLMSRTFDYVPFPNDYLTTYAFSADSSFDYVAAADALAFLGSRLGRDKEAQEIKQGADKVREEAEKVYWNETGGFYHPAQSFLGAMYPAPYANVLLNPLWCGYARDATDPLGPTPKSRERALLCLETGFRTLGRPDGFWKTTPEVDYFVGMNPGQLLWDLLEARSPWADEGWRAVWRSITPSGEFAEMYDGKYLPWNPPSWGVGTSGRLRPWEGGLNTEALLAYLTGFKPDAAAGRCRLSPHLMEGQEFFEALGLPVGDARFDFRVGRKGPHAYVLNLRLKSGGPLQAEVDLWGVQSLLSDVSCDGEVEWKIPPREAEGRRAVLLVKLVEGVDRRIEWKEGGKRPNFQPPPVQPWIAPAIVSSPGEVVLFTSPSAVLASLQPLAPKDFPEGAAAEVSGIERLGVRVSVLDVDLPLRPSDVAAALLDAKGKPRARLAVFGRGAFTPGKHDFKTAAFWADPVIGDAVGRFLEGGGSVWFGSEAPGGRRGVPDWLSRLTGGGWKWVEKGGGVWAAPLESESLAKQGEPYVADHMGFTTGRKVGEVDRALEPLGSGWAKPLVVADRDSAAGLILRRAGKGLLVKTELPMEECRNLLQVLASPDRAASLRALLPTEKESEKQ